MRILLAIVVGTLTGLLPASPAASATFTVDTSSDSAGLTGCTATPNDCSLRGAIAHWLERRYGLPKIDPASQVIPVAGTREALFAFAQCVVDGTKPGAKVLCPNPFYQIYEGAALLANAEPIFINNLPESDFGSDFGSIDEATWRDIQLVYVCSPGNPTGRLLTLDEWKTLFELSDRYGFVIAADECYSEIYFDDADKPIGGLEAAWRLGQMEAEQASAVLALLPVHLHADVSLRLATMQEVQPEVLAELSK